jgi:hypothetical protein
MSAVIGIVIGSCAIGLVWAWLNYLMVKKVQVNSEATGLYESVVDGPENREVTESEGKVVSEIGEKISEVIYGIFRVQKSSSNKNI